MGSRQLARPPPLVCSGDSWLAPLSCSFAATAARSLPSHLGLLSWVAWPVGASFFTKSSLVKPVALQKAAPWPSHSPSLHAHDCHSRLEHLPSWLFVRVLARSSG